MRVAGCAGLQLAVHLDLVEHAVAADQQLVLARQRAVQSPDLKAKLLEQGFVPAGSFANAFARSVCPSESNSDDMLIIRGVNVFPTQIEEIVLAHAELSGQYQLHVSRDGLLDEIEVHCEMQPGADGDAVEIAGWVQRRVKTLVGISTRVKVLTPDSIERTLTGKARRVIDKRPK